jgi:CxxC-x17-CxxC domain-containing protein
MSDQQISCADCGDTFVFSQAEQAFYSERGLASPPKRCKPCRQARKQQTGGRAQGGGAQGGGRGGGNRRFTNDVNEYRSPMTGGHMGAGDVPGRFARGASEGRAGGDGWNGRGGGGGGADGGGPRRDRGGPPRQANQGSAWGGNASEYRSPAFQNEWSGASRGGGRSEGNREGGERANKPREAKPRPDKPRFDIKCAECGKDSQVPFKPLEGRQVFCQECYRARRGLPRTAAEPAPDVQASDSGIVE